MRNGAFLLLLFFVTLACNEQSQYGRGGTNACQYVKEQALELREDIAKVEAIEEDSLLSDIYLDYCDIALFQAEVDYYEKRISRQRLDLIIDSVAHALDDLQQSWTIGNVVNDSLRKLGKYQYQWRKAYKVKVTMKSGVTKYPRVLMESDGVTPYCLEKDIERAVIKHTNTLTSTIRDIIY